MPAYKFTRSQDYQQVRALDWQRGGRTDAPGTNLQVWTLTNVDSVPTTNAHVYSRGVGAVVDLVRARAWSELNLTEEADWLLNTEFHNPGARLIQTPAAFDPPYDTHCGRVDSDSNSRLADQMGIGSFATGNPGLSDKIWGAFVYGVKTPGSPDIFKQGNGSNGYFKAFDQANDFTNMTHWLSMPNVKGWIDDPLVPVWQNSVLAQRCRYRANGVYHGWEASCDLIVQSPDWTGGWVDGWTGSGRSTGWDSIQNAAFHRYWARGWKYRKEVVTTKFDNVTYPHDFDMAWTEIELPEKTDEFYTPSGTVENGFLGRMIVHIFEPKDIWQDRTGFSLDDDYPPPPTAGSGEGLSSSTSPLSSA